MKSLTPEICSAIDKFLAKYPIDQRQSAVVSSLMLVQKFNNGWLTTELMDLVAEYICMPKIAVYEVASFYSMINLKPIGKHNICVCTNISCMLAGSDQIMQHLQSKLHIHAGETTADQKFTLKVVECLGACKAAPMMQIGDHYHEHLSTAKVDEILASLE
jgi:NADH-quinone oxidoreductase subunit E